MHTHDCIHEHLPRLASQRTPQRYVAPEKAAIADGGGTAQALRIHVSAESLSSDPGRACFAEGESYSPFEGGDEYTCASADVITAAKRAILLEQLMPQATSALSGLLRVQRLHGPLVLGNARCGYGGGVPVPEHKRILKSECPHIIVGTPGRVLQLVRDKDLVTKNVKHFILDECDKMLEKLDMRSDVQEIFLSLIHISEPTRPY